MGQTINFIAGCLISANAFYGIVLLRRTMPKNWVRLVMTLLMVLFFYVTALWAMGYVPLTLYRRRRSMSSP